MASFYVIRGKDYGQHFAIRGANATIGREATNQIQLRDNEVSRKHARILRSGGSSFDIVDNNSSNGTFVNGHKVTSQALKSGDRVQIGRTLMIFTGGPELQSTRSIDAVEIVADHSAGDVSQIRSSIDSVAPLAPRREAVQKPKSDAGRSDDNAAAPSKADESPSEVRNSIEVVYQVSQAINRTVDLNELLGQVLDLIFTHIECDRGCILIQDDVSDQLTPVCSLHRANFEKSQESAESKSEPRGESPKKALTISRTILEHVCTSKEGVLTGNAQQDSRWENAESVAALGVHEAMCVPMLGRYGLVGAIYVDTSTTLGKHAEREGKNVFDEENLKLTMSIAGQAALAVEDTQFYQAMVQSERLAVMGQTIANLSHHVKNILQGVSGGNYLVEDGIRKGDLDVIKKGWNSVQRNQERISTLVMDMLSYSKEREPSLMTSDLCDLIDEVVQLMKGRATDDGVAIVWRRPSNPITAEFDSEAIHRALLNVVGNAIDAAKESREPEIEIEAGLSDDRVQISVMDNGPGIPDDVASRIFVPFESTKGSSGTGLGLPVSQKILREHGGDITYRTKIGQGTAFILYWPAQQENDGPMTMVS